jgi:anti-sigma factor RsiW
MMEHICEEQLALYAAGDLAPDETNTVAGHVQHCQICHAVVAGFRETQSFLASSLIDPPADELSVVRERIRLKLRQRRGAHWRWASYAAGVAAAIALMFTAIGLKPAVTPQPAPVVARFVPPEAPHVEIPQVPRLVLHSPRARHRDGGIRSVDLIARADKPMLLKMTTADPEVVILWQSNEGIQNE